MRRHKLQGPPPGHGHEALAPAQQRRGDARGMREPLGEARGLGADEALGERMLRVAPDAHPALVVGGHDEGTPVRAVQHTGGNGFGRAHGRAATRPGPGRQKTFSGGRDAGGATRGRVPCQGAVSGARVRISAPPRGRGGAVSGFNPSRRPPAPPRPRRACSCPPSCARPPRSPASGSRVSMAASILRYSASGTAKLSSSGFMNLRAEGSNPPSTAHSSPRRW